MIAWLALAQAADLRPFRATDTVESLADGDPERASRIRALNGLGPDAQPRVGDLVEVPPPDGPYGEQQAFLIARVGRATLTDPAGEVRPAEPFQPIEPGWTLCTGVASYATLRLASTCNADGSASDDIVLSPETCVAVDAAFSTTARRSTVVRVTRGEVAVLDVAGARGHVTIVTPSGITTGADGGFRVTIEPRATRTEALTGAVAVQGAGREVALRAGQGSRVKLGEAPSPPVDLLPAARPLAPDDGAPLLRAEFRWEPVPDALGYRLEIAADRRFRELLFQEDVDGDRWRAPILLLPIDGRPLHWRIASFDRFGFLGVPSAPRAIAVPEAP